MNAKYHAIHQALTKINQNLDARGTALMASPYSEDDPDRLYQMLIELVPVGSKVSATYMSMPGDVSTLKTVEGVVSSCSPISRSEPSFHIDLGKAGILLPGSVLTELA